MAGNINGDTLGVKVASSKEYVQLHSDNIINLCNNANISYQVPNFIDSDGLLYSSIIKAISTYQSVSKKLISRIEGTCKNAQEAAEVFDIMDKDLTKKAGDL